ncbi:hypothetical protein MKEN_01272100 [Mycena kentingensis (nom. inval.)]|nr:hypothetical protein MKEN_01272100 [Mycena kentingensis (nom. inval.)]
MSTRKGSCFCGAVNYTVSGSPVRSAFCHCTRCQKMNGSPCIWTIHFPNSAFAWTTSDPAVDGYATDGKLYKTRYRCKACGVCIASYNSKTENWSIWGTQLERGDNGVTKDYDAVKPTSHMFYGTAIISAGDDGLGRWEGYEGTSTPSDISVSFPASMADVDMEAPQISTLKEESTSPVVPHRKVKLLVKGPQPQTAAASGSSSTSRKRPISALKNEEEEEDELIDDDIPSARPTAAPPKSAATAAKSIATPTSSTSEPPTKKKAPYKRKPRNEKKVAEEERIAAEKQMGGAPGLAPTMTWFEVSPHKAHEHSGQMGTLDMTPTASGSAPVGVVTQPPPLSMLPLDPGLASKAPPAKPVQKKEKAPRKTAGATRGRGGKATGPKPKAILLPPSGPEDMTDVVSEAGYSVTNASSPVTTQFDHNTPEPDAIPLATPPNENGNALTEEPIINLHEIPLPQYPLPLKPFPVQPPPKITSGFAPTIPLDRSGAKVRAWRVVNREIRGIAGGRWVTKTWVGAKESQYALVAEKQAAAAASAVAVPKLPSLPSTKPSPKPKAPKAAPVAAPATTSAAPAVPTAPGTSSSLNPSTVPSRATSAVPTPSKMRTVVAAPPSDAGDSVVEMVA